jgi:hypothetical protein
MKQHQEAIESLLKDLRKASKLIDGACEKSCPLDGDLDRSSFIRAVGEAITRIFDLETELFDLEPTLTYNFLKPSLNAIELDAALERLLSQNQSIRESTVQEFKNHMLDEIASQFAIACESETGHNFAQMWWDQQRKPFFPVVSTYKFLKHDRRFMRYQSAKVLEERFGVKIWDSERDDVSLEIAEEWFNDWLVREAVQSSYFPEL